MEEVGIDIKHQVPRRWSDSDLDAADVVVTMGCGDECPYIPGKRYLDWDLTDPKGLPVEQVRAIRDDIAQRVEDLVGQLEGRPSTA